MRVAVYVREGKTRRHKAFELAAHFAAKFTPCCYAEVILHSGLKRTVGEIAFGVGDVWDFGMWQRRATQHQNQMQANGQRRIGSGQINGFGGGGFGNQMGGSNASSEIATWVQENFTATTIDGSTLYDLTAPTA